MLLETFRIINCFGFVDSGEVDLKNPHNFIYILGRNSSGKTSLLTAIENFSSKLVPDKHPNFENFKPSDQVPKLIAKFDFHNDNPEELKALLTKNLLSVFYKYLHQKKIAIPIRRQDLITHPSIRVLSTNLSDFWELIVDYMLITKSVWIERTSQGYYRFTPSERMDEELNKVRAHISHVLDSNLGRKHPVTISGNNYIIELNLEEVESILINNFPQITLFNTWLPLDQNLPPHITDELLSHNNELERALLKLFGEEQVRRFLSIEDPDEKKELLQLFQKKMDALTDDINRHDIQIFGDKSILQVTLYPSRGIQLTVRTDKKISFYSHLSERTKILFSYYLYLHAYEIDSRILLFDEPNNGFHSSAQEFLLNFLKALGRQGNSVIVSTHSEHLIDSENLSGIRIMSTDEKNNIIVKNRYYTGTGEKGDYLALRPIIDAIGLRYANQINLRDKVILTEGITDMLYLRAFRTILKFDDDIFFAPARGDSTIAYVIPLLISQGLNFKIVIDTDEQGAKERIKSEYGIDDDFFEVIPIPLEFQGKMKGSGIEDLFTRDDFKKLLETNGWTLEASFPHISNSSYVKTTGQKRLVAEYLYSHSNRFGETDFEEETVTNFRRVLDFCLNDKWFGLS